MTNCPSLKPVYLISGPGGRIRDDYLAQVRELLLEGCDRATCLRQFDPDKASIGEILDELRTLPFLGSRRVVEIHQADKFISEHRQTLEEYLASPSATGVLVLVMEKKLPGNQRITKAINKIGQCFAVEEPKSRDVPRMIAKMAKDTYGKGLGPGTAQALQGLIGDSLSALAEELEKLSLYVGDRPMITVEDVRAVVGDNRELSVFEIIDALVRQDTGQAMTLMERVLQQDRNAEYSIIGLLAWHVRRLRKAQVLLAKGLNDGRICAELRVWYRRDEFMKQARRIPAESLRLGCKQLAAADHAVKTGAASVRSAVEKFILSLTAAGSAAR